MTHPAHHKHECVGCTEGLEAAMKKTAEDIAKYGFAVHGVHDYPDGFANYHTHGIAETVGHPDFQIVMPLPFDVSMSIFWTLFRRVKDGERFAAGQSADRVIKGYQVRFLEAREDGRDVLRLLLPDKNGKFPGEPGCVPAWAQQATVRLGGDLFPEHN